MPLPFRGRIIDTENGYAVTLSEGWIRLALTEEERPAMLQELADVPDIDLIVAILAARIDELAGSGVALVGTEASSFSRLVSVTTVPADGTTLDDVYTLSQSELRTFLGATGKVTKARVSLPGGESVRLSYRSELREGQGPSQVHQYLLVSAARTFALAFAGPVNEDALLRAAAEMADTFEMLAT